MHRRLLLPLLLLVGFAARAQQEFRVDDFSPLYYAKIHLAQPQEVFSSGWISIHDRKTDRQLLKVTSEELAVELHEGQPKSNVQQLPYGEQSVIISADFNFDGRLDLAIEDGQNSCYHGPSYQVFLGTAAGLRPDSAFTRLAQEYCGMFRVDAKRRRLSTMTKSGCCWHEFSEFEVRQNAPFLVRRVEESAENYPFLTITEETWNGKKLVGTVKRRLALDDADVQLLCAFRLAENGKRVLLFSFNDALSYALLRPDETVEFSYPTPQAEAQPAFTLRQVGADLSLRFQNGTARYEIRETAAGQQTVTAQAGGKTLNLTGTAAGRKGSLKPLLTTKLENLAVQP